MLNMSGLESEPSVENPPAFSRFLPGGIPLTGAFARFGGKLYECGSAKLPSGEYDHGMLVLSSIEERPGPEWQLTWRSQLGPLAGFTEWSRVVHRSQAEETFWCRNYLVWQGIGFSGSTNVHEEKYVGMFWEHSRNIPEEKLRTLKKYERLDAVEWFALVPLDDLETLKIYREQWPESPKKPKKSFWRLFR